MAEVMKVPDSVPATTPTAQKAKTIIGIYGLPGSGKTHLLNLLKQKFQSEKFKFYEGSQLIDSLVPGGLEAFQALTEREKKTWRRLAINSVAEEKGTSEEVAVVVGHYMFWKEDEEVGTSVITQNDLNTYTHILYLDAPPETIVERCHLDVGRIRPKNTASHLHKWQQAEKTDLRRLCYDHGILFTTVPDGPQLFDRVSELLENFQNHSESYNRLITKWALTNMFPFSTRQIKTLLVIDADKTLTASDTGELFWKKVCETWPLKVVGDPLKVIFGSNLQYSYNAFRQAMLVYEETLDNQQFNRICNAVASATIMYPEFVSLLQAVTEQEHTHALVLTCGLSRVWELVLERQGLSKKIKVIGGGRLSNGYVVTGDTKTELVAHVKTAHNVYVCAFGDSPLDLGMLKEADRAIVVVGDEQSRSKTMEPALLNAIDNDDLRAAQVILPGTCSPRLTLDKLPLIQLSGPELVRDILRLQSQPPSLDITHATDKNAA